MSSSAPLYGALFRHVLSRFDPETAHHLAFLALRAAGLPVIRSVIRRAVGIESHHEVVALGLRFPTPFGVAAGFDKNAEAVLGLGALGFGHIEIGTVTAVPQPGNPRPRLFRLVGDRALVNRMGFNNRGADAVAERLRSLPPRGRRPIVGVNIGKSRVVEVDDAIDDYLASTRLLAPLADYLVVNVSSPNTPGLRGLQEVDRLRPLLAAVNEASGATPLLVKIAPDLDDTAVDEICALVAELGLAGLVATNTTVSREGLRADPRWVEGLGAGGLSGAPLAARSLEVLRRARAALPSDACLVSVGGVETGEDVAERLAAGATLVQGYTGFVYEGPLWARAIARGLARA